MASLESVHCKLARAKQHYDSLIAAVNRHFQGKPAFIVEYKYPEAEVPTAAFNDLTVPLQIPLIIGDCLQNLRSSLD
jgi:hypothetical protein